MRSKYQYLIIIFLAVWVFFLGWGWVKLSQYENTAQQVRAIPQQWPLTTKIPKDSELPTLLLFLHPNCPCSSATMTQLSIIMAHSQNKVRTEVIFVKLPELSPNWAKNDLYNRALHIPGVHVMIDDSGHEAKIFHAQVSGETMLYDNSGKLVFNGGITSSRGHEGDNDGQDSIISYLTTGIIIKKHTPIFGCYLFNNQTMKS